MNMDLPDGVPTRFGDLTGGTSFMFWRNKRIFGICVTSADRKMALVFDLTERYPTIPWLAAGGLPNDTVVAYPTATIRTEWSDATEPNTDNSLGAIIVTAEARYIRGQERAGNTHTFNLLTGAHEAPDRSLPFLTYPKWKTGIIIDDDFEPIYEFPPSR